MARANDDFRNLPGMQKAAIVATAKALDDSGEIVTAENDEESELVY